MRSKKAELESSIEAEIREYALRRGWMVMKFVSPGQTGVPDRLFIRRGIHIFIEVKKLGEMPTEKQFSKHREMRDHGAIVFWTDKFDDSIRGILK
jgi:Holliday junction resolvase